MLKIKLINRQESGSQNFAVLNRLGTVVALIEEEKLTSPSPVFWVNWITPRVQRMEPPSFYFQNAFSFEDVLEDMSGWYYSRAGA